MTATIPSIVKAATRRYVRSPYNWSMDTWEIADAHHTDAQPLFKISPCGRGRSALPAFFELTGAYATRIKAIRARYVRFVRHMTETRHDWQIIETHGFMDNSTEVTERSRLTGETRRRMTEYPHGDLCF